MSGNSQLADASSYDEEDTRPIAATLAKNTKVTKAPKDLPCTPVFFLLFRLKRSRLRTQQNDRSGCMSRL
jgi:hypothetical protein